MPFTADVAPFILMKEINASLIFLQKLTGSCNPKGVLDGVCDVTFNVRSEETRFKNVFKTKRCFHPFRSDVKKIVGKFVKNNLEVS